jgi:hypothetical protein
MKKSLSEIKKLGKTKAKKPKQLGFREFLNMVIVFSYSVILEDSNFKQFCEMVEVSQEVREKLQSFARTKSFASYISNPIFTMKLDPEYKLRMPTKEEANKESERFGLVILKNLVKELGTQSVESIAAEADEIMQAFEEIAKGMAANDLGKIVEGMGI